MTPKEAAEAAIKAAQEITWESSRPSGMAGAAIDVLERQTWAPRSGSRIRPSIACFRSASETSKSRWEAEAEIAGAFERVEIGRTLELLYAKEISL
jgi:hypothetical protein